MKISDNPEWLLDVKLLSFLSGNTEEYENSPEAAYRTYTVYQLFNSALLPLNRERLNTALMPCLNSATAEAAACRAALQRTGGLLY